MLRDASCCHAPLNRSSTHSPGWPPRPRAKPTAQKKLTKEQKAAAEKEKWAWMPAAPAEAELKFSLMEPVEGGGGFVNGPPPGGDPPNRGKKELPRGRDGCLQDLGFVISGTLDSLTRCAISPHPSWVGSEAAAAGTASPSSDSLLPPCRL
jgi:hypothetical protein